MGGWMGGWVGWWVGGLLLWGEKISKAQTKFVIGLGWGLKT